MTPIRLPDPFEPLRCLRSAGLGESAEGPDRLVVLRAQRYLLRAPYFDRADLFSVDGLCAAVKTALDRAAVQRAVLSRCGFDQAWERALENNAEQTYRLWRGLLHIEYLGEIEGQPQKEGRTGEQAAPLRAAKAMLLGDLHLLSAVARAELPERERGAFQLSGLLDLPAYPTLSRPPAQAHLRPG